MASVEVSRQAGGRQGAISAVKAEAVLAVLERCTFPRPRSFSVKGAPILEEPQGVLPGERSEESVSEKVANLVVATKTLLPLHGGEPGL